MCGCECNRHGVRVCRYTNVMVCGCECDRCGVRVCRYTNVISVIGVV